MSMYKILLPASMSVIY